MLNVFYKNKYAPAIQSQQGQSNQDLSFTDMDSENGIKAEFAFQELIADEDAFPGKTQGLDEGDKIRPIFLDLQNQPFDGRVHSSGPKNRLQDFRQGNSGRFVFRDPCDDLPGALQSIIVFEQDKTLRDPTGDVFDEEVSLAGQLQRGCRLLREFC